MRCESYNQNIRGQVYSSRLNGNPRIQPHLESHLIIENVSASKVEWIVREKEWEKDRVREGTRSKAASCARIERRINGWMEQSVRCERFSWPSPFRSRAGRRQQSRCPLRAVEGTWRAESVERRRGASDGLPSRTAARSATIQRARELGGGHYCGKGVELGQTKDRLKLQILSVWNSDKFWRLWLLLNPELRKGTMKISYV